MTKKLHNPVRTYVCPTCGSEIIKTRRCEITVIDKRGGYVFCDRKCAAEARKIGGEIHSRTVRTCLTRYGVDNVLKAASIIEKRQRTIMQRYGVRHHWQLSEIRNKTDWDLRNRRGHETMKRNGTYAKSKIEDRFYIWLCNEFGKDHVKRQVQVPETAWPIDFYVSNIDTYVQFDGVYWHGLDRPIEVIAEQRTPRDKQIHKKWLTDRKQDQWFIANDLKLVRITDRQFRLGQVTRELIE